MNNWFEVGEEIALRCKDFPEYDGDYIIEKILEQDEGHVCRLTGKTIYFEGTTYLLNTPLLEKDSLDQNEIGFGPWSIFKKYKGCGQDYNEMIKSLNIDIVEVV